MFFHRSRGIALRATLIRVGVESAFALAGALAFGAGNLAATTMALLMAIYLARGVLWLIRTAASALTWALDRRASATGFAEALHAVRLPVTADMRGEKDVTVSLGRAALDPGVTREAAAFAYATQGFVEAVHLHCDPVAAAMVTSNLARGMDLYIDQAAPGVRREPPPAGGSLPMAR